MILRSFAAVSVLLLLLSAAPPIAETIRYDIVTNGTINGTSSVVIAPNGGIAIDNRYQSQDKDRALTIAVTLDAAGLPVTMRRAGQAFAFSPIDESYTREGTCARWRNRVEDGASDNARDRYYVPFGLTSGTGLARDGAAYELGLFAAALLRAPGRRLDLLPVGSATAEIVDETTVRQGNEPQHLRLVSIAGTSLDPIYLWLDDRDRLFAGAGAIRHGWIAVNDDLARRTAAIDDQRVEDAVRRAGLATKATSLVIRDVAVFDARLARIVPHRTVTVVGDRIVSVTAATTRANLRSAGEVIDGRGKTLLPGLWDMHVHLQPREVLRHLASGVTTVRDMGNVNTALERLDARVRDGKVPGPTILRAGFMDASGPTATYNGTLVSSEAEALAAVDDYAREGFVQIKLYNAIHPEWVAAIARRAHRHGLRVSGHVPFGATVQQVTAIGYDEIQHFIYPMLSIAGQPAATPLTFNTARAAQTVDVNSPATRAFIALMRQRHIAMDMTLSVYEPLIRGRVGQVPPVVAAWSDRLPAAMLRQATGGPLPTPPDLADDQFRATLTKAQALMLAFRKGGIQLLAGTDQSWIGGFALSRELELMVAAGLTPVDVLRIATFEASRTMGRGDAVGQVSPGQQADLLLVDGDPTQDIARIRTVDRVIKSGIAYHPADLLAISGSVTQR